MVALQLRQVSLLVYYIAILQPSYLGVSICCLNAMPTPLYPSHQR